MNIDVTNCDLRQLVAKAYDLSSPQGMGFLHFKPEPLSDGDIDAILARGSECYPVAMDYVKGRAVKLSVRRDADKLTIYDRWHDHSDYDLAELCKAIGAAVPERIDA